MKAAKEQQALDDEMMPNGGRSRGLFRKSRKSSQQVLTTRGISLQVISLCSLSKLFKAKE